MFFKHALVRLTGNHRMYVLKSVPMRNILSPASQTPAVPAQSVRLSRSTRSAQIPASYGNDTVYNYVHPNNHRMIEFLRKRGYTVLNLIEIRKPYQNEKLTQTITVGEHEFDY